MPFFERHHISVTSSSLDPTDSDRTSRRRMSSILSSGSILAMKRSLTGSFKERLRRCHGLRALSENAQYPPSTASTSVTPSPVKSPKRSALIGLCEPPTYSQAEFGSDNFFIRHSPFSLR